MDVQASSDYDFYNQALIEAAQTTFVVAIVASDNQGNKLTESKLEWLTSLAIGQGYIPIVFHFNASISFYTALVPNTLVLLQLPAEVFSEGYITPYN